MFQTGQLPFDMMSPASISVIVASHNRASFLWDCLSSLETQDLDRKCFEVIVIDDGSTDDTQEVLEKFNRETCLQFRYLHHENAGVSASRNRGIACARFDYIAFTDDDCILPNDWLGRILLLWKDMPFEVAGIGGPLDTVTSGKESFASQFLAYIDEFNYVPVLGKHIIHPVHVSRLRGCEVVPYLRTSNSSFRRNALITIGGFDPAFRSPGGEDPDLCYRLMAKGYRFHFEPELLVAHLTRESLQSYFRTVANYVRGELRKSRKIAEYPLAVRNSYRMIPLQKILSLIVSIWKLPYLSIIVFKLQDIPLLRRMTFPFVIVASKYIAFVTAVRGLSCR